MGCHFLLQGIFPTQGSSLCLLHCRQIVYPLSHWVTVQFSQLHVSQRMSFPHYISCLLSGGLRAHRSASSFLGSLFYSIDLCVCWWPLPGFFLSFPHQISHTDPGASVKAPPVAVAQGNSPSAFLLQVLPSPPVPKTTQGFIGWRSGVPGLNKCLEHDYEIRSCKGAYAKELNWPKQGIH